MFGEHESCLSRWKNVVLDENSVEWKPCINIESKLRAHNLVIQLSRYQHEVPSSCNTIVYLSEDIKTIIYKYEDQKYLPLYLHNAKTNFYSFCQGSMTNPDYLDKLMNLTDMAESYKGTLHDAAVIKTAHHVSNLRNTPEEDLDKDERKNINSASREIYLSCAFVITFDPERYGRLVE